MSDARNRRVAQQTGQTRQITEEEAKQDAIDAIRALDEFDKEKSAEEDRTAQEGQIIRGKKKRTTMSGLKERYPEVEVTPVKNVRVIFNGVAINFFEGVKMKVPSIFKDIYEESLSQDRAAFRGSIGVGGLQQNETIAGLPERV